jgi:hypothetical protein
VNKDLDFSSGSVCPGSEIGVNYSESFSHLTHGTVGRRTDRTVLLICSPNLKEAVFIEFIRPCLGVLLPRKLKWKSTTIGTSHRRVDPLVQIDTSVAEKRKLPRVDKRLVHIFRAFSRSDSLCLASKQARLISFCVNKLCYPTKKETRYIAELWQTSRLHQHSDKNATPSAAN